MARSENKGKNIFLEKLAIGAVVLAILTPFFPFVAPHFLCGKDYLSLWSNLGEYVGGMGGTLLSFAGVLLILKTVRDQQDEMKDMRLMHEEQQFEATFFQALNGHNELVKCFEMSLPGGRTLTGRVCLLQVYRDFASKFRGTPTVEQIFNEFIQFSQKDHLIISQFLQSIEKLVDYTHKSEVDIEVKRDLLGFISAQLTYYEEFLVVA
jgi:hypothetical protein